MIESVNMYYQLLQMTLVGLKCKFRLACVLKLESFKSFDFDEWRQQYMAWIRDKKFRITDFFRHQDKRGEGMLTREQFVEGMMASSMLHVLHNHSVSVCIQIL